MSDRIDAILDTIDEALSAEPTAVPVYEGVDTCDRCGARSAHGEKCAGCRAFLLGDSASDPRQRGGVDEMLAAGGWSGEDMMDAMRFAFRWSTDDTVAFRVIFDAS